MNVNRISLRSRRKALRHRALVMLLASLGSAVPVTFAASASAAATTVVPSMRTSGCDSGYVCIYKGDIWDDSPNHPMVYSFYRYGTYNVANLIGDYTVVNCQTGGAGVKGFTGRDGTGNVAWDVDINNCNSGLWTSLTSTNSVRVYA
ncbi:hypothetical protein [Embleya sp. NPDC020886]|uniref:hypothetical protein n=1 Tax=Embleya sp. NPDC020886 TaxID=3363980 RepID=UPI0037A40EFC